MSRVVAYHVIFTTYGFWLPNDPRGSGSDEVRSEPLQPFGEATKVSHSRSVASKPHDRRRRLAAKAALKYPEVVFTGRQAQSVGTGFGGMVRKAGYVVHACTILPQHAHLVVARHRYSVEQVGRLLRQAATARLLTDGLHPFAELRSPTGRLPSVWAQDFWRVFLFTPDDVRRAIRYAEDNPLKEGKPRQTWSFVTPYTPPVSDAYAKRR
jgi:REP element-mobilizing transposase RayT